MKTNRINQRIDRRYIKSCPKWIIVENGKILLYPNVVVSFKTLFLLSLALKVFGSLIIIVSGVSNFNDYEEYKFLALLLGAALYLCGIQVSAIYRGAKKDIVDNKRCLKSIDQNLGDTVLYKKSTTAGKTLWEVKNNAVYINKGLRKYNIFYLKIISLVLSFICSAALIISVARLLVTQQIIGIIYVILLAVTFLVALYYKKIADISNAIIMNHYQMKIDNN